MAEQQQQQQSQLEKECIAAVQQFAAPREGVLQAHGEQIEAAALGLLPIQHLDLVQLNFNPPTDAPASVQDLWDRGVLRDAPGGSRAKVVTTKVKKGQRQTTKQGSHARIRGGRPGALEIVRRPGGVPHFEVVGGTVIIRGRGGKVLTGPVRLQALQKKLAEGQVPAKDVAAVERALEPKEGAGKKK